MKSFKLLNNIVGWSIFAIAAITYYLTAESTGSLWDCGEFIAGAYKLEVVHPPGAPLFLLIGRFFIFLAETFTDTTAHPENIAFVANFMSGICTAFSVLFMCWSTTILGKLALVGRKGEMDTGESIAVLGAGAVAGLSTTFATSVWFSAVEGEVYAMSTFFTALVVWSMLKWYNLPDNRQSDRWIVFTIYMTGLSIGVHLLSLLTMPALALLYYFKKYEKHTWLGMAGAFAAGAGILLLIQGIIILKLPGVGANFDYLFVNTFGLPFGSGLLFFCLGLIVLVILGLYKVHKSGQYPLWTLLAVTTILFIFMFGGSATSIAFLLALGGGGTYYALSNNTLVSSYKVQKIIVGLGMILVGFSTYGVVLIRANANTPINMNDPSNAYSLMSYLNREQYGDRPLFYGPHYAAKPYDTEEEDRFGPVGDHYEVVDKKTSYVYHSKDKVFLPRMGHYDRPEQYKRWLGKEGIPNTADNISFALRYQIGWMYVRYVMWNFVGRQNGKQGFEPWDVSKGHWLSGVNMIDNNRLYPQNDIPQSMRDHKARNTYYFLPLIFGLFGLIFLFNKNRNDALFTIVLFIMTGLAIIFYSNQPPTEPRERDYVLVGSIFTYCIWIGLGVLAIFDLLKTRAKLDGKTSAIIATGLVLIAPILMGTQNWDDHSRRNHYGARDYAINFLESCEKNAIIFTHGDNDTYPLWYAQEVENIRTDIRVVNLSLLAVDWYIDQLRRKVNDSPAIKLSIPKEAYRGNKRNQLPYGGQEANDPTLNIQDVVKFMGEDHPVNNGVFESYIPTKRLFIPVDQQKVRANGTVADSAKTVDKIVFNHGKTRFIKDEIAILDIISSNDWDRPIYFAVTCRPEKTLGLSEYLQLEGMGLRLVPIKTTSNPRFGFIGSGRVAVDKMYNNIMTKFKWGGFDKKSVDEHGSAFIDRSYGPSIQSTRMGILRLSERLVELNDKERAANLIDKYFEAYPHENFPYDYNAMYMIHAYYRADALDRAGEHIKILATETADYLRFYQSLLPNGAPLQAESLPLKYQGFAFDMRQSLGIKRDLNALLAQTKNEQLRNEVNTIFNFKN